MAPRSNFGLLNKASVIKKGMFPDAIAFLPEEADRFLDYVIDQSYWKGAARIIKMAKLEKNIRAIGLASTSRVLRPPSGFSISDDLTKTDVAEDTRTLSAAKSRGVVPIYDDDLEDGIEGDAFANHLMKLIATAVANELDAAFFMGAKAADVADAVDIEDLWDGFYKRILADTWLTNTATILTADANTGEYAAAWNDTTKLWEFKFGSMIRQMPEKYRKNLTNLRFFCPSNVALDYVNVLASRGTILGDSAILGKAPLQYGTVPIQTIPLMPSTEFVPVAGTHGDSTIDAEAAAGQKNVPVVATTNFTAGDTVSIGLRTGAEAYKFETFVVDSVDSGVKLVSLTDLVYTHDAADTEAVEEVTLNGSPVILTHKDNFVIGLHRDLKLETERDAANERTLFWFSIRADCNVENVESVVLYKDIRSRSF